MSIGVMVENFDKPSISTNCLYAPYNQPAKNWSLSKTSKYTDIKKIYYWYNPKNGSEMIWKSVEFVVENYLNNHPLLKTVNAMRAIRK